MPMTEALDPEEMHLAHSHERHVISAEAWGPIIAVGVVLAMVGGLSAFGWLIGTNRPHDAAGAHGRPAIQVQAFKP